jgi:hypothetical protein
LQARAAELNCSHEGLDGVASCRDIHIARFMFHGQG